MTAECNVACHGGRTVRRLRPCWSCVTGGAGHFDMTREHDGNGEVIRHEPAGDDGDWAIHKVARPAAQRTFRT